MNEEQLIQFVNWLPSVVPEFRNASPEEIVQSLNQMAESENGQQMLSQLFTAFQESQTSENSQLFKKGGKLDAFLNKYKKGGKCCKKKKEIIQGGMVNKVAEKMQEGGEIEYSNRDRNPVGSPLNDFYLEALYGPNSKEMEGFYLLTKDGRKHENLITPDGKYVFNRDIYNPYTEQADTVYTFRPQRRTGDRISVSRKSELAKQYKNTFDDFDKQLSKVAPLDINDLRTLNWQNKNNKGTGYYVTAPEYQKNGGELATNISTNTLSNFGAIAKAEDGTKVSKRRDGVAGTASQRNQNGTIIRELSRTDPNSNITWYTEQTITPQRDTTYRMWNNTPALLEMDARRFITPTQYDSKGWLGQRLGPERAPENWAPIFDRNFK